MKFCIFVCDQDHQKKHSYEWNVKDFGDLFKHLIPKESGVFVECDSKLKKPLRTMPWDDLCEFAGTAIYYQEFDEEILKVSPSDYIGAWYSDIGADTFSVIICKGNITCKPWDISISTIKKYPSVPLPVLRAQTMAELFERLEK